MRISCGVVFATVILVHARLSRWYKPVYIAIARGKPALVAGSTMMSQSVIGGRSLSEAADAIEAILPGYIVMFCVDLSKGEEDESFGRIDLILALVVYPRE